MDNHRGCDSAGVPPTSRWAKVRAEDRGRNRTSQLRTRKTSMENGPVSSRRTGWRAEGKRGRHDGEWRATLWWVRRGTRNDNCNSASAGRHRPRARTAPLSISGTRLEAP